MGESVFLKEMTEYAAAWEPVDVKEIGPLIISYWPGRITQPPPRYDTLLEGM